MGARSGCTTRLVTRRRAAGALACVLLHSAVAAAAVSFADAGAVIESRTLANGMQIIVWPDHRIPSVSLYNWVRVGSRNESSGRTGLAHFFEHGSQRPEAG